jgi:hypothetical protein
MLLGASLSHKLDPYNMNNHMHKPYINHLLEKGPLVDNFAKQVITRQAQ